MSRKTKALLVGINDYSPIGQGGKDLKAPLNDVNDMKVALKACGFADSFMTILSDGHATKEKILKGLDWLLENNNAGDSLVFYFSGHGSFRLDRDGDESDGKDEVICTHGSLTFISDDNLYNLLKTLPANINLEVFLDSCYSGTGIRLDAEPFVKFMDPPPEDTERAKHLKFRFMEPRLETPNHTLWAACRSNQNAIETNLDGKPRSVFTYYLTKVLQGTAGNITRSDLHRMTADAIRTNHFSQVPQMETANANKTKLIFT